MQATAGSNRAHSQTRFFATDEMLLDVDEAPLLEPELVVEVDPPFDESPPAGAEVAELP